jgi:hypothetical protein
MDDERRQILEESAELDHIWGVWEAEAELTNDPRKWVKQPPLCRVDLKYHEVPCTPHIGNRGGSHHQRH